MLPNKIGSPCRDNLLFGADVLVLLRDAGHLADAYAVLDVLEVQAQVLPRDGQHGTSLCRPGLRRQLEEGVKPKW